MHIIFDFDGVILNSHKIKTKAFYKIFESYGKNIANKAIKFHKEILVNQDILNSNLY